MWYDAFIVAILIFTTIRGSSRGLVSQLAWIVALVLCFAFAESFSLALAPHLHVKPPLNRWISMFVLYIGFSFLSFGVARFLRGWIERARFADYDRHLGGMFGFVKGGVLAIVVTFFVVTLSPSLRSTVLNSRSGYLAGIIMHELTPVMPAELGDVLAPYINHLGEPDAAPGPLSGPAHEFADDKIFDDDRIPHLSSPSDGAATESEPTTLSELIDELPAVISRELRDAIVQAFEQGGTVERQQLIDSVRSGVTRRIQQTIDSLVGVDGADSRIRQTGDWQNQLREISAIYSDLPDAQNQIVGEVEAALDGLPETVSQGVIEDWHADLLDVQPDPDPGTSFSTQLDVRIVRQLSRAGIPINTIGSPAS